MNPALSNTEIIILIALLLILAVCALLTVVAKDLLKSAISLAAASAVLSIIMFIFKSYMAAVFELSVCAGLITTIFISTISLSKPKTEEERAKYSRKRNKKFALLPIMLAAAGIVMFALRSHINIDCAVSLKGAEQPVQEILWNTRKTDVLGQIIIILAGVFGVTILFRERGRR